MFSSPSVQFLRGSSESVTSENFPLRDTLRAVVSGLERRNHCSQGICVNAIYSNLYDITSIRQQLGAV